MDQIKIGKFLLNYISLFTNKNADKFVSVLIFFSSAKRIY